MDEKKAYCKSEWLTWINTSVPQMTSCERGEMNEGLLAERRPAWKILAIRFVLVRRAA